MNTDTGLNLLANKEPVVATHVGIFDSDSGQQTYRRYHSEITTFVISPDILRYQREFVQKVLEPNSTIACLVAPFGYGKTSTAINIWNACEEANLMAIPPFSCNSIAEMGHSIATGLIWRLEYIGRFAHAERVRLMFNKYLTSSAAKLAAQDAKHYDISIEVALQSIEDKIKSGHLQLEASATHLLSFLEELVTIVIDAGFKGLVIIVDEFQQFLGNINKAVITNFRTLIWGLQTRGKLPLGFLITMDPDTERNLTDRGADILHRIRNNGLYLSFSSIYDREFPRELWSRYADTFSFSKESSRIVDHATLEAIGQICERSDLSNGPRTVINIFQRIASLQIIRNHPYSPIDLIDDFLSGNIRFDGDRGKISSLVNEITSYDYIKRSPERIKTIKMIAAFPRGCPVEVADHYNIRETYDYLHDELRGEILVELPEGVALIDLQNVGKPQNKLNIILKKYWLQITDTEIISDKALQNFAKYGVNPLFPKFTSHQYGWRPETSNFLLTSNGGYIRVYEGTFFEGFTQRRVAVQVCFNLNDLVKPDGFVDAQFIFLIQKEEVQKLPIIEKHTEIPTFVVPIPIHQPFSRQLPRDIRDIETFLSPVVLTPGVLISLLNYINEQLPHIEGISDQENHRIQDIHRKLQEFLLAMVISDDVFEKYDIKIYSRGVQAFRDALFNILRTRYPNYQSILFGSAWRRLLDQYRQALEKIPGSQRRGIEPFSDKKSIVALLFEQRQYAGFESYIKQFNGLVEIVDWRSDIGSIIFHRHPQEDKLIEAISIHSKLKENELYSISREQGYLEDETRYLIEFMLLRGYIERDVSTNCIVIATTFSQAELINLARNILDELHFIKEFTEASQFVDLEIQINTLLETIQREKNDLSDTQVRLLQFQRILESEFKQEVLDLRGVMQNKIEQLYRYKARLAEPLHESSTGIFLDAHVNGAQRTLKKEIVLTSSRIEKRINAIRETIEQSSNLDVRDFPLFSNYVTQAYKQLNLVDVEENGVHVLLDQCKTHQDWIQLIGRINRLKDVVNAAAEITDVRILEINIDRIQWEIQQELASEGLKQYRQIYNTFIGSIDEMQREIDTIIRLAETRSKNRDGVNEVDKNGNNYQTQSATIVNKDDEPKENISDNIIDLQAFYEQSKKKDVDFLNYLLELNEHHKIIVYWKTDI